MLSDPPGHTQRYGAVRAPQAWACSANGPGCGAQAVRTFQAGREAAIQSGEALID
jgi:hypothetical protein